MGHEAESTRHTVLQVFGMTLEVSNPRLAELLTMDAGDALGSDVRELFGDADRAVFEQAAPETILSPGTPRSEHNERMRAMLRTEADGLGQRLGFSVDSDGTWSSPSGVDILTRVVERPLTLAAAVHFVTEVAGAAEGGDEHAVLFIVVSQEAADVFKVAIRQRASHHLMRTATISSLREIAGLHDAGSLSHHSIVTLLAPVADIDVGEMLSVLHASARAEA